MSPPLARSGCLAALAVAATLLAAGPAAAVNTNIYVCYQPLPEPGTASGDAGNRCPGNARAWLCNRGPSARDVTVRLSRIDTSTDPVTSRTTSHGYTVGGFTEIGRGPFLGETRERASSDAEDCSIINSWTVIPPPR